MSYLVLARKYRPQTFEQVVGQPHVTQTLQNAISSGRVAHAILFSGLRGTGKTTIARILAKAMNCENGPAVEPCNQCKSCEEITQGGAVDVFEIDGASNNGVEQIRELRENVRYMPAHSRYKIYIIDEVHMLSTAAFNALLKTLEEPPDYILFFFATTEPRKIPVTILSRCQRHDLRRIGLDEITRHLAKLCDQENVRIDPAALDIIARESDGSMRDALSLLDQVLASATGEIHRDQVLDMLGVLDQDELLAISQGIFQQNLVTVLTILDRIYQKGHSIREFYSRLVEHFRNLLVIKLGHQVEELVQVSETQKQLMVEQVRDISEVYLSRMLDILIREESSVKLSMHPKLTMEMIFIRMAQTRPSLPIEQLIDALQQISQGLVPDAIAGSDTGLADRASQSALREPSQSQPSQSPVSTPPKQIDTREMAPREGTRPPVPPPVVDDHSKGPSMAQPQEPPSEPAETDPDRFWQKLISAVSGKYPSLEVSLEKCRLKEFTPDRLVIDANGSSIVAGRIQKHQPVILEFCNKLLGKPVKLEIANTSSEAADYQQNRERQDNPKKEALGHPMVESVLRIFGGNVEEVRLLKEVRP